MSEMPTTEEEWLDQLEPQEFNVLRRGATERPFTGRYLDEKREGTYMCAGCGKELFESDTKFESGSGWPSFYDKVGDNVAEKQDTSHGMLRTEVLCANCGGHLGHVFPDGPNPTGLRYCINGAALKLDKDKDG